MLKQTRIILSLVTITALLSGIALLALPGCEPEDNPKLSYGLNQLLHAYRRGEVEEFAKSRRIELLYDDAGLVSVEVTIESVPGQVEVAIEVAETYGTVEVNYLNLIVAVVPIIRLSALADEESIDLVRIPEYAVGAE